MRFDQAKRLKEVEQENNRLLKGEDWKTFSERKSTWLRSFYLRILKLL